MVIFCEFAGNYSCAVPSSRIVFLSAMLKISNSVLEKIIQSVEKNASKRIKTETRFDVSELTVKYVYHKDELASFALSRDEIKTEPTPEEIMNMFRECEEAIVSEMEKTAPEKLISLKRCMTMQGAVLDYIPHGAVAIFGTEYRVRSLLSRCVYETDKVFAFPLKIRETERFRENVLKNRTFLEQIERVAPEIDVFHITFKARRVFSLLEAVRLPSRSYLFVLAQVSINKETQAYKSISFEIPGGKRELLESSEQCAFREFREEVGFALAGDMIDADTRWILIPSHKMKVALVDLDKGRE